MAFKLKLLTEEVEEMEQQVAVDTETPDEGDLAVAADVIQAYVDTQTDAGEMVAEVESVRMRSDIKVLKLAAEGASESTLIRVQAEGVGEILKKVADWFKKIFQMIVNFFKSLVGKMKLNMKKFKVQIQDIKTVIEKATSKKIAGTDLRVELKTDPIHLVAAISLGLASPGSFAYLWNLTDLTEFAKGFNAAVSTISDKQTASGAIITPAGGGNKVDLTKWLQDVQANSGVNFTATDNGKENINRGQNAIAQFTIDAVLNHAKNKRITGITTKNNFNGKDTAKANKPLKDRLYNKDDEKNGLLAGDVRRYDDHASLADSPFKFLPAIVGLINLSKYETAIEKFQSKMEESLNDATAAADKLKSFISDSDKSTNAAAFAGYGDQFTKAASTMNTMVSSNIMLSQELMGIAINAGAKMATQLDTLIKNKGESGDGLFTANEINNWVLDIIDNANLNM